MGLAAGGLKNTNIANLHEDSESERVKWCGEELHLIILYILLTLYLGVIIMLAYYIAGSLRLGDIAGGIKEFDRWANH